MQPVAQLRAEPAHDAIDHDERGHPKHDADDAGHRQIPGEKITPAEEDFVHIRVSQSIWFDKFL